MKFARISKFLVLSGFISLTASAAEVNTNIKDVEYCTVCHGTNLKGNPSTGAPRLSGLNPWYAKRQLENFQKGLRGYETSDISGNEMRGAVEHLSPELVKDALELIANSESEVRSTYSADLSAAGKDVYTPCAACHGEDGKGNEQLGAPSLLVQSDWYLARQLAYYRDGKRGAKGADIYAASMKAAAQSLTDEQIDQVVAYISQIQLASATEGKEPMKKVLASLAVATVAAQASAEVIRHPLPNNSTFPIARAVEVSPDTQLIYHSGQVPSAENEEAEEGSREYYGDTETQAMSVFKKFESSFKDLGVDFGDVVKMTVFMVGDPEMDGEMDFDGFMRAYTKYFGTKEQPNLPARSAIQIAGLAGGPGMLIEIEMVIAKPQE